MKINSRKTMTSAVATLLLTVIFISLAALPVANSHTPPWEITTKAFLTVNPNPVGVGQKVIVVAWAGLVLPGANVGNDIRFHDYKVTITKPDNSTDKIEWDIIFDTTSTAWSSYTPDQVGTYSFVFSYPDQIYTWNATGQQRTYYGDIYLGATSKTVHLTVQQEPLPEPISSYPLPSEYWTRPIEGQNTDWWTISSHWLGSSHPSIYQLYTADAMYQTDGAAPNSAHIMWTKRIDEGGVVGGSNFSTEGEVFYSGLAYQPRFNDPIIMNGLLYYAVPLMNTNTGGGYMCVDLRTGEEVWYNEKIGVETGWNIPSFGYLYAAHTENQHGVIPRGVLFSNNFGVAYDPWTGQRLFNVTDVPSGTAVVGPQGEILRYQINLRNGWLAQWNSSRLWVPSGLGWNPDWNQTNGWIDASSASRYDWNVTIPTNIPTSLSARYAIFDDVLIGSTNLRSFTTTGTPNPYTIWAISLKPTSRGQLMWMKDYPAPPANVTRFLQAVDKVNRVLIFLDKETFQFLGYSIDNGEKLWETTPPEDMSDFAYFDTTHGSVFSCSAYGRLYNSGFGGVLYCYDTNNGDLLWTYGNGGEGNSTSGGLQTPWGRYPLFIASIADGKVFLFSGEHSPNTPLYKGLRVRAVNATTGEELWTVLGSMGYPPRCWYPVADGFVVYHNVYDGQLYCIGKGPSATTVSAPDVAVSYGTPVMIKGMVTDISPGTEEYAVRARFPNGVPAVSDASMGAWMEYVYMQKPRPLGAVGVDVTLSVLDANGNFREIGTVTGDSNGFFHYTWIPDVPGDFTVYASFAGSESYWPSHAVTAFTVEDALPPEATPEPLQMPPIEMYFLYATAAIIIAIVIVGVVMMLMLRKK